MARALLSPLLEGLLHIILRTLLQDKGPAYLLSPYCVPGTVLGSGTMTGHKTHNPCPEGVYFLVGE